MATETQIKNILKHPLDYDDWTIQGLGMVRLDLNPPHNTERLHIWTPTAVVNDVVSAHDHPWKIDESRIVVGIMRNQRFRIDEEQGEPAQVARVICGIGSHLEGPTKQTRLAAIDEVEEYGPDESYSLDADQLHDSYPDPGTVTVMSRSYPEIPREVSIVWEGDDEWRQEGFTRYARKKEILSAVALAQNLITPKQQL